MNTWQKIVLAGLLLIAGRAHAEDTVHYYYTDPQGTVLAKADAAGNVIASYDYAPYGSLALGTPPASGPTGYTGHVNDPETGLVYMQARYYDPGTGRFLSVDPVEPSPGYTFNFNRYDYTSNNPINHIDPDGKQVGEVPASIAACAASPPCAGAVAVGVTAVAVTAKKAGIATAQYFKHLHLFKPKPHKAEEHTKNARSSTKGKHEKGDTRRGQDAGNEKGDKSRRPPKQRPDDHKGPWPPKPPAKKTS